MTDMDSRADILNPFSAQPATASPLVTGVSPREGIPGTKVTIRGENLGMNASDITSIKVCGIECVSTLAYMSDRKVIIRTGRCVGKGDVIIHTRSGGLGSSLVGFTGKFDKVGPLQETSYWIDEDLPTVVGLASKSVSDVNYDKDILGIREADNPRRSSCGPNKSSTIADIFIEGDGCDVTKFDFNPIKYLTQMQSNASIFDLKNGLKHLKLKETRDNSSATLVKTNIVAFFDAVDIIQEMRDQIIANGSTYRMKQAIQKVDDVLTKAHHMYDSDLKRKANADLIRDCMSVIERFKFLFFLPRKISQYADKEEFGRAINDYVRAKSLFDTTEIKILSHVMNAVESEIQKMSAKLVQKLFAYPQSLDEQRDIIRHLESINKNDSSRDFAGQCVSGQADWVVQQLNAQTAEYEKYAESHDIDDIDRLLKAFDRLSESILGFLREIWDISSLYVRGQLSASSNSLKTEDERLLLVGEAMTKCCSGFVECVKTLFLRDDQLVDVGLYGTNLLEKEDLLKYRLALLPEVTIRYKCTIRGLNVLDIPSNGRTILMDLLTEFRTQCLSTILLHAACESANLHKKSDWSAQNIQTHIPDLFVDIYVKAIKSAVRFCLSHNKTHKERDLLTDKKVNKSCQLLLFGVIAGYFSTFEQIILNVKQSRCERKELVRRCVLLYVNLEYTHETVLPKLERSIASLGFKDPKRIIKESSNLFDDACSKVSEAFVEQVVNSYVDDIQKEMWAGGSYDWSDDVPLTGVRSYVYLLLNKLCFIQNEISGISHKLTKRLTTESINGICTKVFILYTGIDRFSYSGSFAAALDATAIYELLHEYFTKETKSKFRECVENKIPDYKQHAQSKEFKDALLEFSNNVDFIGNTFARAND